jgi:translation initiation factor IF-1
MARAEQVRAALDTQLAFRCIHPAARSGQQRRPRLSSARPARGSRGRPKSDGQKIAASGREAIEQILLEGTVITVNRDVLHVDVGHREIIAHFSGPLRPLQDPGDGRGSRHRRAQCDRPLPRPRHLALPMKSEPTTEGVVTRVNRGSICVRLDDTGHELLTFVAGRLMQHSIRIMPGDRVRVALTEYDLHRDPFGRHRRFTGSRM